MDVKTWNDFGTLLRSDIETFRYTWRPSFRKPQSSPKKKQTKKKTKTKDKQKKTKNFSLQILILWNSEPVCWVSALHFFVKSKRPTSIWHQPEADKCFFRFLFQKKKIRFTARKRTGVCECHGNLGMQKTTIFTSLVYVLMFFSLSFYGIMNHCLFHMLWRVVEVTYAAQRVQ